jgi:hypothetical protein
MHAMAMQQKSNNTGIATAMAHCRIIKGRVGAEGERTPSICSEAGKGKSVAMKCHPCFEWILINIPLARGALKLPAVAVARITQREQEQH